MKPISLLFPGQGAQSVGMGADLAEAYPSARAAFDEAAQAVGFELDRLCFEGPIERLSASDVAQPAILTVSIAALRALEEGSGRMPPVAAAAGLSLGEYTALVAGGAMNFADAVRLVRKRGLYMQEACEARPGVMYSVIGLEDGQVEDACTRACRHTGGRVWPANYNSPGQLVISGEAEAAGAAADLCRQAGARRVVQLNVAGAFHTPLMEDAARKLEPELRAVPLRRPAYPVVSNVTGEPADGPDEIRDLLLRQVTSPVRWTACVRWVLGRGVADFYEVGPGTVLRGLLKRTDDKARCRSVGGVEAVKECAVEWSQGETT